MTTTRRPWKVFVRDIGPTFAFATEVAARERALQLVSPVGFKVGKNWVGCYSEVLVYDAYAYPVVRTIYRPHTYLVDQVFDRNEHRWVAA